MKTTLKTKSGQALTEFSLTISLYLALMLMAFDFGSVAYQWTALQYAANQGARIGSLGYINDIDPNTADEMFSTGTDDNFVLGVKILSNHTDRIDTIKAVTLLSAAKFGIILGKEDVTVLDESHSPYAAGTGTVMVGCIGKTGAAPADTIGEKLMYVRVEKDATLPVLSSIIQSLLGFSGISQELNCKLVGEALTRNEPFSYTPQAG